MALKHDPNSCNRCIYNSYSPSTPFNSHRKMGSKNYYCKLHDKKHYGGPKCKDKKEQRMNEWKKLDINNLPPDIMSGKYEFFTNVKDSVDEYCTPLTTQMSLGIGHVYTNGINYKYAWYRKKQPPQPQRTHEEIMTNWFYYRQLNGGQWVHVVGYQNRHKHYLVFEDIDSIACRPKEYFNYLEMAEIPPEEC